METHTEEDASVSAQKFIFTRPEERKIRRRFIGNAVVFDVIAIALVIPLCVGGWVKNGNQQAGNVNSGDVHLATWSVTFRRSESLRESTFAMTWFLSSTCYQEVYFEKRSALAGCIRRTMGATFNLQYILADMNARLAEERNAAGGLLRSDYASQEGHFEGARLEGSSANWGAIGIRDTGSTARYAVVMYAVYMALNLGAWLWHIIRRRHRSIPRDGTDYRAMGYAHAVSLVVLAVASSMTTVAAFKANEILSEKPSYFSYHAVGTSFLMLTWGALASHLLGLLSYFASVWMWGRLQRPELYPPEPEPEERPVPRIGGWRRQQQQQRPGRPGVHREADPDAVADDELPPYSRVDPNEGSPAAQGSGPQSAEHLVEARHSHEAGGVPAPAYELHDWPRNDGNQRETRGN